MGLSGRSRAITLAVMGTDRHRRATAEIERDILSEAYEVLKALGHHDSDARRLLDDALDKKQKYKDVDSLLHAIYEKSHS